VSLEELDLSPEWWAAYEQHRRSQPREVRVARAVHELAKWDDPAEEWRRNETPGYWLRELDEALGGDEIGDVLGPKR
jgi:hypothetical protein